jgi:hypothetical protein
MLNSTNYFQANKPTVSRKCVIENLQLLKIDDQEAGKDQIWGGQSNSSHLIFGM